jgi:hypothetical protein
MSRSMDALMQAQHKASEALYKQQADQGAQGAQGEQGAQGAQGSQGEGAKPDGDVIDAEVVEDEKK